MKVTVIGAGLAGTEAAYYLAENGIKVLLIEQKGKKRSPAHSINGYAELVCSNSLKAIREDSAGGLLKKEMRAFGSVCMQAADSCRVPAGGALAVNRSLFSLYITEKIKRHPNIEIVQAEQKQIPEEGYVIVATGPLTEGELADDIKKHCGEYLSFYDAAAPIVTFESIDMNSAFLASRYNDEDGDYINCPMNKEEYEAFHQELIHAESAPLNEFDHRPNVYEGCMPVEIMGKRGMDTLRFGPLKPVGLRDPKTGHRPWAVVQLRKENSEGTLYNLVGFQTNLRWPEQKRVFSLIPALKNAEYIRYGVMHRNTFINSPKLLNADYSLRSNDKIFFAGQITGVEGYMESASSGIMAAVNVLRKLKGEPSLILPKTTMLGALAAYISDETVTNFQPMGANFGILEAIEPHIRDKKQRNMQYAQRSERVLRSEVGLGSEQLPAPVGPGLSKEEGRS